MDKRVGVYLRVDPTRYRHIWVVGDLHGSYRILKQKLKEIDFDFEKDLLISVGDLIDRGLESAECLELINYDWFLSVQGNHEQMARDALFVTLDANLWIYNGGLWFFYIDPLERAETVKNIRKTADLPLVVELNIVGKRYVIAHADYPRMDYRFGADIDEFQTVWNRDRINSPIHSVITGADQFIFGHSTPKDGVFVRGNQLYIDTGIYFTKKVTLTRIK